MKRVVTALILSLAAGHAAAQACPSKPVTVIVPWPAGGPSDIAARPVAKGLSDSLKQTFVIDNRAGASGNIGTAMVTKAAPDGCTLLMTSSSPIVINANVFKSMPFDAQKDLVPITNRLNAEAQKVMKGADFQRVLAETGSDYVGDTPENFARFIQAEHTKWAKVAKDSGATLD